MIKYLLKILSDKTFSNFLWRSVQVLGKQGVVFIIFLLGAKYLSVYDFGIYNYLLSILVLVILIGDFGISLTTSKYVVESDGSKNAIGKIIFNSIFLSIILSSFLVIFTLIFGQGFLEDKIVLIYFLIPSMVLAPLTSIYDGVFRGLKLFKKLSIITLVSGVFSVFISFFLIKEYGLTGAIIANNFYYLLLLVLMIPFIRMWRFDYDKKIFFNIFKYSFFVGLMSAGYFLFIRMDILFLGYYNLISDISYYEIVNKIFMLLVLPITLLGSVVAPDTTKAFQEKNYQKIKSNLKNKLLILFLGGIFASFCVFGLANIFLQNSEKYNFNHLLIFLIPFLFLTPFKYVVHFLEQGYLLPGGYAKKVSFATIFFGVLNVILNYILFGRFGLYGITISTFFCLFLLNIFIIIFAIKQFFYSKNQSVKI